MRWNLLTVYPRSSTPGAAMTPAKQQQWQQSCFSIANFSKNINANTSANTLMFLMGTDQALILTLVQNYARTFATSGFGRARISTASRVWQTRT